MVKIEYFWKNTRTRNKTFSVENQPYFQKYFVVSPVCYIISTLSQVIIYQYSNGSYECYFYKYYGCGNFYKKRKMNFGDFLLGF